MVGVADLTQTVRRLFVVGDELVAGFGDPRALGWVGRVVARSSPQDLLVHTLAVAGETTTGLSARWESEVARRRGGGEASLVLALGAHDLVAGTSMARSRLNLANVLDKAEAMHLPVFVVGPPPRTDLPDQAQAALSAAFADVCHRRRVPYVETYQPLATHEQWSADLASTDGVHPAQAGHGLLAWLVLHHDWAGWIGTAVDEV
ncbi:GDSL-type esterase/lipase family protein [Litorihabitans aurantiacus]|uniref:Lysophospholipase n=1 Tax=Litorihabitans aurantiacus TaxID=1930061 RepID=A0AA37UUP2_9MICO|nr:GDSL-type esterase/lipase family protein [Litorihabitans aurantiacus]GMA30666.1 lysophospholipase [Litorihabitans aurantiacus]